MSHHGGPARAWPARRHWTPPPRPTVLTLTLTLAVATAGAGASAATGQQAPRPWQQGVEYRIEATLDETTDVLSAAARVRYTNESPDTLRAFYFHLYLNAFRPNSAWARRDLVYGIRTFQDLGPEDHAFDHLLSMRVDGQKVATRYPYAPDSTIVRLDLPRPLPPGGEITLDYTWDARLSTVPRRQGRAGRHYDFAQWYPRVVVYDLEGWRAHPLYRQGEFYGEFATYDVTLDLSRDQVMGATGVPVEGDPGWKGAAAPGTGAVTYQRDWYGAMEGPPCVVRDGVRTCGVTPRRALRPAESLGLLEGEPPPGRKRVRWYAEDVHHFAWSTDPAYIYEQGNLGKVAIHVLYRPGDEAVWGGGTAAQRTAVALRWLDYVFGPYGYPQVTNVHRLEGGGTEFPMMVMNGGASQGLITHEVGHIYAHGMLANNEWYEGWLDEGMTSFQTAWFFEEQGAGRSQWLGSELRVLNLELRGKAEPVTLQAERYAEMGIYSSMIYTKGSLVLWMLREMAGKETFRRVLRTFYERYRFRHVDQYAFQSVAEEVMRRDLDWFFGEWLHANGVVDYALGDVSVRPSGSGFLTRFEVERRGEMIMPVPVRVEGRDREQAVDTVVPGDARTWRHEVWTPFRPRWLRLDPRRTILDWNALNDTWSPGPFGRSAYRWSLDDPAGGLPLFRDRAPLAAFPLAWLNDAGGVVLGFQARTSYLGSIRRGLVRIGAPAVAAFDRGDASSRFDPGSVYARIENPILFGRPRYGVTAEGFAGEGRLFVRLAAERDVSRFPLSGPRRYVRAQLIGSAIYDTAYLVPGRWTPVTRQGAEAGFGVRETRRSGARTLAWDAAGSAGFDTDRRLFARAALEAATSWRNRAGWSARARLFLGATLGRNPAPGRGNWGDYAPRERRFFLSGRGPYATLANPWLRSRGAVLGPDGVARGGGGLLGFDPAIALGSLGTLTGALSTPEAPLRMGSREVAISAHLFGGVGTGQEPRRDDAPGFAAAGSGVPRFGSWRHVYSSAGMGLEMGLRRSPIRVRVDLPLLVGDPAIAARGRDGRFRFRWVISVTGY